MRATEYHRIEMQLDRSNLGRVPIVFVRGKKSEIPSVPLSGLIISGSDKAAHPEESASLDRVVREAAERGIPILALTDSAPEAARALGRDLPAEPHDAAVLILKEVRALETRIDVRLAIDSMAKAA
jgi:hypothetical protein